MSRADTPACQTLAWEVMLFRGPGLLLAGLCVACGRATVFTNGDGLPQHLSPGQVPPEPATR